MWVRFPSFWLYSEHENLHAWECAHGLWLRLNIFLRNCSFFFCRHHFSYFPEMRSAISLQEKLQHDALFYVLEYTSPSIRKRVKVLQEIQAYPCWQSYRDVTILYYPVEGKIIQRIYLFTNCSLNMINSKRSSSRKGLHLKPSIRNFISLSMKRLRWYFDNFCISLPITLLLSLMLNSSGILQRYQIVNGLVKADGVPFKDVEAEDQGGELSDLLMKILLFLR